VQKAVVVLVQRRTTEAASIRSQHEVVLDFLEREVQAVLVSELTQVPIE
jgi:hypothetical protein